jgi:hypothetical protein
MGARGVLLTFGWTQDAEQKRTAADYSYTDNHEQKGGKFHGSSICLTNPESARKFLFSERSYGRLVTRQMVNTTTAPITTTPTITAISVAGPMGVLHSAITAESIAKLRLSETV